MKYYIVESKLYTNNPQLWSVKKVFRSKKAAQKYLYTIVDKKLDLELPVTEWEDGGPNWKTIECWDRSGIIVTLEEIDNDYKED